MGEGLSLEMSSQKTPAGVGTAIVRLELLKHVDTNA